MKHVLTKYFIYFSSSLVENLPQCSGHFGGRYPTRASN